MYSFILCSLKWAFYIHSVNGIVFVNGNASKCYVSKNEMDFYLIKEKQRQKNVLACKAILGQIKCCWYSAMADWCLFFNRSCKTIDIVSNGVIIFLKKGQLVFKCMIQLLITWAECEIKKKTIIYEKNDLIWVHKYEQFNVTKVFFPIAWNQFAEISITRTSIFTHFCHAPDSREWNMYELICGLFDSISQPSVWLKTNNGKIEKSLPKSKYNAFF